MDETGLCRLFWATGLPEAYLALSERREQERRYEPAKTAFAARPPKEIES